MTKPFPGAREHGSSDLGFYRKGIKFSAEQQPVVSLESPTEAPSSSSAEALLAQPEASADPITNGAGKAAKYWPLNLTHFHLAATILAAFRAFSLNARFSQPLLRNMDWSCQPFISSVILHQPHSYSTAALNRASPFFKSYM